MATTENARSNNKARNKRFAATLPVSVGAENGSIHDISVSGMFIVQSAPREVGSPIDFTIDLDTPMGKMKIFCAGTVARIEEVDGKTGVGVKIINQFVRRFVSDKLHISDSAWNEAD